jgi:hypothetical protein
LKPVFLFLSAAVVAAAPSFAAEPVVRVKAKLTAFDGQVMTLEALPSAAAVMKAGESFSVSVLPGTRYVGSDKSALEAIKPGDYAGAAATQGRNDTLRAQEVYLYSTDLRGSGEGRFPEGDRIIVNGTVSAVQAPPADSKQGGSLTLHYRGALLSGLGLGKTLCEGRASPPAYASALACEGDAVLEVPPGTGVSTLAVGDKSLLVPGSTVTVAMTKDGDKNVTPGIVVEKSVVIEKPQPLEKPQSAP